MKYEDILVVVKSFYAKATEDILIGYHFRNIEDFDSHLPRIADFWYLQLNEKYRQEPVKFDLIDIHIPLRIRKGQIGRWIVLFQETLNEFEGPKKDLWLEKLNHFQKIFLKHPKLNL